MDERRLERLLSALHRTDNTTSVLQRLCAVCTDAVRVEGAGLSAIAGGRHEILAASDADAQAVEVLQVTLAQGPCVDVLESARPFLEPDLASAGARSRWPQFAEAALELGVSAVFAFPLMQRGASIGALDVYAQQPGDLGADQYEDAVLLADLAALAVGQGGTEAGIVAVGIGAEVAEPWAYPGVVHQASGMVAEQLGIGVAEALLRLRAVGFVTGVAVVDVARDVVGRRLQIESWADDA